MTKEPVEPPYVPDEKPRAAPLETSIEKADAFQALRQISRLLLQGLGWFLFGAGILIIPLPGPFGLPIALLGLIILMRTSLSVRRYLARWRARQPNLFPLINLLRKRRKKPE